MSGLVLLAAILLAALAAWRALRAAPLATLAVLALVGGALQAGLLPAPRIAAVEDTETRVERWQALQAARVSCGRAAIAGLGASDAETARLLERHC